MTHPIAEGTQTGLGRYRFREVLSTSFFGPRYRVVYEAMHGQSDAPVFHPNNTAGSGEHVLPARPFALRLVEVDAPSLLDKLARAVQAVRDVDHVAVLKPLKIVRANARLGVVTAHVEGTTLAKLLHDASLNKQSISPSIALRIVSDVLDGLQALQHRNRDLLGRAAVFGGVTPDSIHVGLDGQTRYIDPGLASAAARHSRFSHEAAALAYTAPEQTGAEYNFAAVSDIFSLGVVLWELLTLRPLFGASTAAETLQRVHQAQIPRVQRQQFVRGEPIAATMAQVVAQALRREPAHRYASYDEFAIALNAAGTPASRDAVASLIRSTLETTGSQDPERDVYADVDASQPRVRMPIPNAADTALLIPPRRTSANDQHDVNDEYGFEPPTTRIEMPDLTHDAYWPVNAAWSPPPETFEASPKITAFPIGDLLRAPLSAGRDVWSLAMHRDVWTVAAASAVVIGLGLTLWNLSGDAPSSKSNQAAASQGVQAAHPVEPATDTLEPKPPASPPATKPAAAPSGVAITPDAGTATEPEHQLAPAAQPNADSTDQPSPPPRRRSTAGRTRHNSEVPNSTAQQFIPDDI